MSSVCMLPCTNCSRGALRPGIAACAKLFSRFTVYSSGLNSTGTCTPVTVFVMRPFSRPLSEPPHPLAGGDDPVVDRTHDLAGHPVDLGSGQDRGSLDDRPPGC